MNTNNLSKAPVLLLAYRKIDFLAELRTAIINYSPTKLYISHDYYRDEDEMDLVMRVREELSSWELPFEVEYIFYDKHHALNGAVQQSIDYVFSKEETLIVLEDDTIPSESFFPFCNAMLRKYAGSEEVGSIVGCNLGSCHKPQTFFLGNFVIPHWGWASWANKWKAARRTDIPWGTYGDGVISKLSNRKDFFAHFLKKMTPEYISWDVTWAWALALNAQKSVLPGINLVTNRGFVPQGTYTNFSGSQFENLEAHCFASFELKQTYENTLLGAFEEKVAMFLLEIIRQRGELDAYGLNYDGAPLASLITRKT